jgi:hypothetical protein
MAEAATPTNTLSKDDVAALLDRMEAEEHKAREVMSEAMNSCKPHRNAQKDIRQEAKDGGISKQAFNALWAIRKAQMSLANTVDDLDDDAREQFATLAKQLGTEEEGEFGVQLTLGQWAQSLAEGRV